MGLTKGNLSSHLSKLEQGRLVQIEKAFEARQPVTYARLTPHGREALTEHWRRLDALRAAAKKLNTARLSGGPVQTPDPDIRRILFVTRRFYDRARASRLHQPRPH